MMIYWLTLFPRTRGSLLPKRRCNRCIGKRAHMQDGRASVIFYIMSICCSVAKRSIDAGDVVMIVTRQYIRDHPVTVSCTNLVPLVFQQHNISFLRSFLPSLWRLVDVAASRQTVCGST